MGYYYSAVLAPDGSTVYAYEVRDGPFKQPGHMRAHSGVLGEVEGGRGSCCKTFNKVWKSGVPPQH